MRFPFAVVVLLAVAPAFVTAQDLEPPALMPLVPEEYLEPVTPDDGAVMQGLDKVTARISTFQAPIGFPIRFGTLEITVRACHKTPPEEPPESAAFLEVVEVRPDELMAPLFQGWMFASSPALSALEHAVYDVWVIDCINASNSAPPKSG